MKTLAWTLGALGLLAAACGGGDDDGNPGDIDGGDNIDADTNVVDAAPPDATPITPNCTPASGTDVRLEPIVTAGLERAVWVGSPPNDARLFVIEQPGRIRIIEDGTLLTTPFLDIQARVDGDGDNEQGLLGLAFHPQYATNGRFFVNYVATSPNPDTVIAEFTVSTSDPNVADDGSEQRLMTIDQHATNHNGGNIMFGPEGFLYIGMGDGGGGGDDDDPSFPNGHGQNNTTLRGAMLRIDVSTSGTYAIPADNPFANSADGVNDPRREIWAIGLRNPWRFSFDRDTGDLYIADVGQGGIGGKPGALEEISMLAAGSAGGANFGWRTIEGSQCFDPTSGCVTTGLIQPISEYGHGGGRCSITGGYVYRGTCMPDVQGTYFYGDACTGQMFSFPIGAPVNGPNEVLDSGGNLVSFGEDATGEVYVVTLGGSVFQIVLN